MYTLEVLVSDQKQTIPFAPGKSLRRILEDAEVGIRSGCLGNGGCGLCRVRILAGAVPPVTLAEEMHLGPEQLARGERLACQVLPEGDLSIENLSPAPRSQWKLLDVQNLQRSSEIPRKDLGPLPGDVPKPYGLAVDLGTTHLRLSLFDLLKGQRLTGRFGLNPQSILGADALSRVQAASSSQHKAREFQDLALRAIGNALRDIASRDGLDQKQVVRVLVVGNTAMLSLLSGRNHELLLQPRNWSTPLDCLPLDTKDWPDLLGVHPEASIELAPPLSGFVGSDVSAGILATGLLQQDKVTLFMDCGTNSEIALWDGSRLWVTAAAGGPAFEGSGIHCGMPAEPGAIVHVCWKGSETVYEVLPGRKARGLCGSGLVDLLACLLDTGVLTETGRFTEGIPASGHALDVNDSPLTLRKMDVDVLQQAKAAIGAGVQVLLAEAGMPLSRVQRLYVAGAFGRFLNVANAQRIGLLPLVDPQSITLYGDTALGGCERLLLNPEAIGQVRSLQLQARHVNLASYPEFEDLLLENLYLRPMSLD